MISYRILLRDRYIVILLFLLFLGIAIPRIMFPGLDHADEFADSCTLTAGKNFVKLGFLRCRFLPMYGPQIEGPKDPYTHYPPLPEIMNGVERLVFKTDSLRPFRAVSLVFALLNLLFWYLFIRRLSGSYLIGFLAGIFYFTNPYFIFGMDAIRELSSADAVRSLILFTFAAAAYSLPQKRRPILWFLWAMVFVESWLTLDYMAYLSLFFILFKYTFPSKDKFPSWRLISLLLAAPVSAFFLHFLQNAWYFGSLPQAFHDLKNISLERIASSKDSPMPLTFLSWWQNVIARNFSLVLLFNYFILLLGAFVMYVSYQNLPAEGKKKVLLLLRLIMLLAVCGISWYILFPAHSLAHAFVLYLVRHLVPVASVVFALFCYMIFVLFRKNTVRGTIGKVALAGVVIIIVNAGIGQSTLPITKETIAQAKGFLVFKDCLMHLKGTSSPKDKIAVNYYRFPFIRYYTERDTVSLFTKQALQDSVLLPRYFIFLPYNDPLTQELYQALMEKYVPLYQCNSIRFPSIFFKLKD